MSGLVPITKLKIMMQTQFNSGVHADSYPNHGTRGVEYTNFEFNIALRKWKKKT